MDRQKMKVKVCLVGEGAVGKTCLIRRFIQDQFDDRYISTLGVLAVCDLTRKETLDDLGDWVAAVVKVTGNVPIAYLGNKCDLKDQMVVSRADLQGAAQAHGSPHLFTSAKTGENVEVAFSKLAQMITQRAS